MFLRGWDIRIQPSFPSKVTKNRACNPNMLFDASNHINNEKVTPKWSQQVTQKSSKIDENQCWDIQERSWVHPYTHWSPKWCQSGTPRPQNASKTVSKTNKNQQVWMQVCLKPIFNSFDLRMQVCLNKCLILQILQWFQFCRSFKSCKSIQIANYKSAGCQRGRRQGRSLKIYTTIKQHHITMCVDKM